MQVKARAKVNLTLEVFPLREDGYHPLRSIVVPIDLYDVIEIEKAEGVTSDTGYPDDLCIKAAKLLGVGAKIHVEKHIPVGGGLGGGSADGAAVLRGLNELYALNHSPEELAELGAKIGSDVPALVLAQHYGRPVLMEGRGEKVSLLDHSTVSAFEGKKLWLFNPGVHSSTKEVYAAFDRMGGEMPNSLERAAIALYPEIAQAKAWLIEAGAENVMMSGSGSTVFGFADVLKKRPEYGIIHATSIFKGDTNG